MTAHPTISAAIITLNEQHHLPTLLARLAWVNEIVVVDGGSTDDTVAIAQRHGCRVAAHPFHTFAQQRNRAIELAQSDWILSIDADERPTPAIVREIRTQIARSACAAFRVPIRSRIFGRPFRFSGTQDDRPIRLFRRGDAVWSGDVHEVLRVRGRVGALRAAFEHETLPTLTSFLQKMQRYTTLAARHRVATAQPPRWRDRALAPAVEVGRRLIWKGGLLDGPEGWMFCLLSGLSQWVLADKHRRWWQERTAVHDPEQKLRAPLQRATLHF